MCCVDHFAFAKLGRNGKVLHESSPRACGAHFKHAPIQVQTSRKLTVCHIFILEFLCLIHQLKKKQCCLALRNSISRNKEYGEKLLELKIEDTLRQCLNQNDQKCYDEVKSVLRDLGCQVELKELWTGTGKNLNN